MLWTCSYVFRPSREDDLNIPGNIAEDAWVLLVFTDLGVLACLLCGCANEGWKLLTFTTSDPDTWLVQQHYLGKHLTHLITTWWTLQRRKQRRKKGHPNWKGKVKESLFTDDVILHVKNPKDSTKNVGTKKWIHQSSKIKSSYIKISCLSIL